MVINAFKCLMHFVKGGGVEEGKTNFLFFSTPTNVRDDNEITSQKQVVKKE